MVMFEPFWVGYRTYYFYEFLSKDKRVAMSAAAAGGRVSISSPHQLSSPCCNLIDACHDFISPQREWLALFELVFAGVCIWSNGTKLEMERSRQQDAFCCYQFCTLVESKFLFPTKVSSISAAELTSRSRGIFQIVT